MEFVCYSRWQDLPASSEDLFAKAEQASPFFSRRWLERLTDHALEVDKNILLACVIDDDAMLALLPLIDDGSAVLSSLSNRYSALFTIYIAEHDRHSIVQCLSLGLSVLPFDTIKLEPMADDDEGMMMLQQQLLQQGFSCDLYPRFNNWVHHVAEEDFEQYMMARPGKVRNTIERKSRRLQREHGYDIRVFENVDELQRALADYTAVYRASWKVHEPYQGLVDAVVRDMAEQGSLRLGLLYVDDKPIAGQIWFVTHGTASILRLAYDESWKSHSPGSILTRQLMQLVIDRDGVECIDYLMGDESYKQDWMTECRQRVCMECSRSQSKNEGMFGWLKRLLTGK